MFSGNNLISAATGEPIVLPSQDMVLGLYYLTAEKIVNNQTQQRKQVSENSNSSFYDFRAKNYISTQFLPTDYCFSSFQQVFQAYQLNLIHAHSLIWLKWNGNVETKSTLSIPHEIQVTKSGDFEEIRPNGYRRFNSQLKLIHQFVRTTPGRVFLNLRIQQYF
jgi:DNA-directed RNA polymerase subunit beta'